MGVQNQLHTYHRFESELLTLANCMDPLSATGRFRVAFKGYEKGVAVAFKLQVTCTCEGRFGSQISARENFVFS